MALLQVVTWPAVPKLYRSRNRGVPCFFRLQAVDTPFQFRLDGHVLSIHANSALSRTEVTFMESGTGNHALFTVVFDPSQEGPGHADWTCAHEEILLEWCGVEPRIRKLLAAHDIRYVADLAIHTEEDVCRKLLTPGFPMTKGLANEAVARYVRLRDRLKQINVSHNPCDADDPASVRELRALLHG